MAGISIRAMGAAMLSACAVAGWSGCGSGSVGAGPDPLLGGKADSNSELVAIAYGQTLRTGFTEDRVDLYDFSAEAGDVVSIIVSPEDRFSALEVSVALTTLAAIETDAVPVAQSEVDEQDIFPGTHLIDVTIPRSGQYIVVTGERGGIAADYRLRLACTGGPCEPGWRAPTDDGCELSAVGKRVLSRMEAETNPDHMPVAMDSVVSHRNAVGQVLRAHARQLYKLGGEPLFEGTQAPYEPDAYRESTIFPTLGDFIASAQYEVDIRSANVNPSDPLDEVMLALARLESRLRTQGRRGDPVLVRVIADAFEIGPANDLSYAKNLATAFDRMNIDPQLVRFEIATHHHFSVGEDHSKIIVVDGAYVHIGGANPQDNNRYDHPEHDAAFMIMGEVAQAALLDFDHSRRKDTVELWQCTFDATGNAVDCEDEPTPPPTHRAEVLSPDWAALGLPANACVPMIYLSKKGSGSLFTNRTDHGIGQGILGALDAAQSQLRLESPNLNDDAVLDGIVGALMKDPTVRVQIVVPPHRNDSKNKLPGGGGTNEHNHGRLLGMITAETVDQLCPKTRPKPCDASRAKEAEITGRIQWRWFPVAGDVPGAHHIKYVSVDGQLAIVGSANLDTQSMNRAREAAILIDDADTVARYDAEVFVPDFEISKRDETLDDGVVD